MASRNGSPATKIEDLPEDIQQDLFKMVQEQIEKQRAGKITGDEVRFHQADEKYMVFPRDMTFREAARILERKERDAEKITSFSQTFKYRKNDGLVAAAAVMSRMFGMTLGKTIRSFFGDRPPELTRIPVGPNKTVQVPEGMVEIPQLENTQIFLGASRDREFGVIFAVNVEGPAKYRKIIDTLFEEIEKELAVNSIYRGHVLSGAENLDFIDLSTFDPSRIVFSDEVVNTLDNALFSPIRNTRTFELDGIPLKRSILLYGPYGTGKSSIGATTGQIAEANGWTYLMARTGRDKVEDVLKTARLYEPAVVFIEDIDTQAGGQSPMDVARLLDAFDGITAKDSKLIMVMTTNHVDKIHKGMLRPGRLDFTQEIGALDRNGIEKLIKVVVGEEKLDASVDYDAIWNEMGDFEPAYVRATADRAKTWAVTRTGGRDYTLTTEDLVGAAKSLHGQLDLQKAAQEGTPAPTIDSTVAGVFQNVLLDQRFADTDGDLTMGSYVPHKLVPVDKDDKTQG